MVICPICLKHQIRRLWADFLCVYKICLTCEKALARPLEMKEIPFYQNSLEYLYSKHPSPAEDFKLFTKEIHGASCYFPGVKLIEMTNDQYLGLVLNRDTLIVFSDFLLIDDLEALEHFQSLNIIEVRAPNVL